MKEKTVNDINEAVKGIQDKWYSILSPNEIEFRKPGRIRDPIHGYHKLLEIDFALWIFLRYKDSDTFLNLGL